MPIETVSSEASGKKDLSAKLIVHWGRTFSTQKAKNRFFGSARKRLCFSTFLGKRLRSLRAAAIQLHLPGDERYKNHAVAGSTEFESHKMKAFALFRYWVLGSNGAKCGAPHFAPLLLNTLYP
jgi:hypothetical protein